MSPFVFRWKFFCAKKILFTEDVFFCCKNCSHCKRNVETVWELGGFYICTNYVRDNFRFQYIFFLLLFEFWHVKLTPKLMIESPFYSLRIFPAPLCSGNISYFPAGIYPSCLCLQNTDLAWLPGERINTSRLHLTPLCLTLRLRNQI